MRLFKETLHPNGPPIINKRDKIQEEFWGKKIITSDYPDGIEIDINGKLIEQLTKHNSIEEGFLQLIEKERLIHQDDEFQKSIAKKYNACALLELKDQEKKEKLEEEEEADADAKEEEQLEEPEEDTEEGEEEQIEETEEFFDSNAEEDEEEDIVDEGDELEEFEDNDADLELEKDEDFSI